ncbi:MAG: uroporphyrinogen-III C-methyltransferase [Halothiobacillaceae bacterium]
MQEKNQAEPAQNPDAEAPEAAEARSGGTEAPPEAPATSGSIRGLAVALALVSFLLLGSMGAAFWFFAQIGIEAREALTEQIDIQAEQVASLEASRARLADAESLASLESHLNSRLDRLEARVDEGVAAATATADSALARAADVEAALAGLRDELGRDDLAWRLAEASFLMTRAQERLRIARDPEGARVAIDQADRRLASLAMPELLPVREALAAVRTQIESRTVIDRVGWTLKLRALGDEVSRWPLADDTVPDPPVEQPPAGSSADDPVDPAAPWYERWPTQAWQQLARWFDTQVAVTRDDRAADEPPRVPVDRETRLLISALREALVDRDQVQTRSAMAALRDWTKTHYLTTAGGAKALLTLLDEIDAGLEEAVLPDLNEAFAALRSTGLRLPAAVDDGPTGEAP